MEIRLFDFIRISIKFSFHKDFFQSVDTKIKNGSFAFGYHLLHKFYRISKPTTYTKAVKKRHGIDEASQVPCSYS